MTIMVWICMWITFTARNHIHSKPVTIACAEKDGYMRIIVTVKQHKQSMKRDNIVLQTKTYHSQYISATNCIRHMSNTVYIIDCRMWKIKKDDVNSPNPDMFIYYRLRLLNTIDRRSFWEYNDYYKPSDHIGRCFKDFLILYEMHDVSDTSITIKWQPNPLIGIFINSFYIYVYARSKKIYTKELAIVRKNPCRNGCIHKIWNLTDCYNYQICLESEVEGHDLLKKCINSRTRCVNKTKITHKMKTTDMIIILVLASIAAIILVVFMVIQFKMKITNRNTEDDESVNSSQLDYRNSDETYEEINNSRLIDTNGEQENWTFSQV